MRDIDTILLEERYSKITESLDIFDNRDGIGSVPNQMDLDYFGFSKPMSVKRFRSLVPAGVSGEKTKDYIISALKRGEKIGPPFLIVKWLGEAWKVLDHEGRSRSDAIAELWGNDQIIPIHIFPYGMRRRNLTDEMLGCDVFIPQK